MTPHPNGESGQPFHTDATADAALLDLLPAAVYLCEAPSGAVVRYNRRAAELWGREPVIGDTCERFCGSYRLHRADGTPLPHADTPMAQTLRTGEPTRDQEVVIERPDGSRVTVLVNIKALRDGSGRVVGAVNVFQDISDRKRAEQALRQSEANFRRLLEQLPAAAYTCDPDGLITFYNPRAVELWGREPVLNDAADRYCGSFRLFTTDGAPIRHDRCWMALALRDNADYNGREITIERPDGTRLSAVAYANPLRDEAGRLAGAVNILVDVTERRRAEAALRKQNERLRLLWEAAGVLLTTDDPDAMLRGLFAELRDSLGLDAYFNYAADEAENALRLVSYEGVPEEAARAAARLEFGQAVCGNVALHRRPAVASCVQASGDPRVQLIKALGVRAYACNPLSAGGRLLGTLSFASRTRDSFEPDEVEFLETVSHHVAAAYERLHLIRQLREADRRKDEFLATLAHELRNPLAPLQNALNIQRLARDDRVAAEKARGLMERQLGQMVRIVDDLLDVSRITRNKLELRREWVELGSVVRAAVETSRAMIDAGGHELTLELPDEPALLHADPTRLAQVFANLLNNSAKYTHPGGHIRLSASLAPGEAVVRVADDGVGIPPDMLGTVFEMFAQMDKSLERRQGGLGIGLTLCRRLVELHGGTITAHSDGPGRGTEFVVRLPAAPAPDRTSPHGPEKAATAPPLHRRVLVVDDNEDAAESLAEFLRLLGCDVRTAHDGLAGVEAAAVFRPEVAVFDIGMPTLNGYEAARRIRSQPWGRGVLMIALTGWGQEEDRRRTGEAGFDHHLVKPVDLESLQTLLARAGSPDPSTTPQATGLAGLAGEGGGSGHT